MRLRYMELHNYRKFREAKIEFPDGVVAIVGQNGTGKTTLLEAVTWALYGNESSVVRDGKEGVMRSGSSLGDECSVVLEFDLGGDAHRLVRSMKGKSLHVDASLEVNGDVVARGDKAVTEAVVKRLGMDHKAFFVSVFAKQKDLNALSNLKPADRKKLVLRMLGVDFLNDVVTNVDKDASAAKKQAENLLPLLKDQDGRDKGERISGEMREREALASGSRTEMGRLVGEKHKAAEGTSVERDLLEKEEERYRKDVSLERRLTGIRAGLQGRHKRLADLEREIKDLEALRSSIPKLEADEAEYQMARLDVERLGELRERHLKRQRMEEDLKVRLQELRSLEEEEKQTRQELSAIPDVDQNIKIVEENLESARISLSSIDSQMNLSKAERSRHELSIKGSKQKADEIRVLGEDSNCPTCERRMGQQYSDLIRRYERDEKESADAIAALDAVMLGLETERAKGKVRKEVLEQRLTKLNAESRRKASLDERLRKAVQSMESRRSVVASLEKEIEATGAIDYDLAAHELARKQVKVLEPSHAVLTRARTMMERLAKARMEEGEERVAIAAEEADLQTVVKERTDLAFGMKVLQERKASYEKVKEERERLEREIVRMDGELMRLSSEMEGLQRQLHDLEDILRRHQELMREQEMLNRLGHVMKGFKENVISRIVPTISEVSSDLLTQLTDGKYGGMRLDDEYQMYIYDQGEEHPLERFSGGESDLANLCMRLAISRMIMERSGSQMNFLVLDEIFGSQDQSRKRNILETLGQLQKQFRQILLITHIDDVKDSVTAVLKVIEKEDGSSAVTLED
jgi:DNA repair protein SbcC/Rad50